MALILGMARRLIVFALYVGSLLMLALLAVKMWDMAQQAVSSGGFIRY